MDARRREFLAGVKAELPILLGVSPFGMIYGVLALSATAAGLGFRNVLGRSPGPPSSWRPIDRDGRAGVVILATTFIVNLRHVLSTVLRSRPI
jgi:predicted branched-subunit amino acid permease